MKSQISLLDLYSQRAGGVGISIELDFRYHVIRWMEDEDQDARKASLALLEPIFEAVFTRIAPKIRHLTLIAPPSEILVKIGENFSLCSSLAMYVVGSCWWVKKSPPVAVVELPRLQHVFLRYLDFAFVLPWSLITTLELEFMPESFSFDALTKCLNLVKFSNRDSRSYLRASFPRNAEPMVHENLESMFCENDVTMYRHFRFTRLRTLHWGSIDTWYDGGYKQIFSDLPLTLVSLTLGQIQYQQSMEPLLRDLLKCVPQLLELRLFGCDGGAIKSTIESIGRPGYPSHSRASTIVGSTILPNLRRLSIVSHETVYLGMVMDMLEALSSERTSEDGFHLEVFKVDWRGGASRRLRALVASGFDVKITTGVEIPDSYSRGLPWW
jgi:hypothetical protein